jgi:hypothetical protein
MAPLSHTAVNTVAAAAAFTVAHLTTVESRRFGWLRPTIGGAVVFLCIFFSTRSHRDRFGREARKPFSTVASLFHLALGVIATKHPLILVTTLMIHFQGRAQPDPVDADVFVELYEYMIGFGLAYCVPVSQLPDWLRMVQ